MRILTFSLWVYGIPIKVLKKEMTESVWCICLGGCHLERTGGVCVLEEIISPGGRGWFGLQIGGREVEE